MLRRSTDRPCGRNAGRGAADCCRPAVIRAYTGLRDKGQPDRFAFEAAVTVYLWHHPEVPAADAHEIVSGWIWNGVSH